ncbi:MAG TPA: DUF4143 domain-containing protein [Spirochaetia bacterium]|nr:DUF4143 domain-containing protein [Spirochaetia bacterium]
MWTMLASSTGSLLNKAKLGEAIGVSPQTVGTYMDLLEATYMVRLLRPRSENVKKRLVKSPKVYVRDSAILHQLLGIDSADRLYGHHSFGASWEGGAPSCRRNERVVGLHPARNVSQKYSCQ